MVIQNIMLRFDKTFYSLLLRSVTLIYILATNYEYDANISLFFRSCVNDCVQADADFSWRPDAGALEAGRADTRRGRHGGQSRLKTQAEQTQDTGIVEARHSWVLWRQDAGRVDARRRVRLFLSFRL